ncbi:RNA 3'-terminal phosphate cyclase [Thermodesulfatator indicus]
MIRIDGSYGEGGGQILRTSLTLSLLTGTSFELVNIRAKRPKPGLRPQHLTCVKAAQKVSGAEVEGAQVGSLNLTFKPGRAKPGSYHFDIGTAGSTALVFQTVGLPLALAGASKLLLKGGTHVPHAPCFHFLAEVYGPVLGPLGFSFEFELRRYGFYPAGGGEVVIKIAPHQEARGPFVLKGPYKRKRVKVLSIVTEDLPSHIRTRQAKAASELLAQKGFEPIVFLEKARAKSPGTVVFLAYNEQEKRAGFFALGKKGKPAEKVAEEAVRAFFDFYRTGKAVDPYLADQLLVPLALTRVPFYFDCSRLTRHFFTNLWVIKQFLPEFTPEVKGDLDTPGEVTHLLAKESYD